MAINDIFKLSVVGVFGTSQQFVNTFHYKQVFAVLIDPNERLAADWVANVLPLYEDILSANSVVQSIEVRALNGSLTGFDQPLTAIGNLAGESLPPQASPIITWRSAQIGRANRGRSYIPAPNEGQQAAGVLAGSYLTSMQNFADGAIAVTDVLTGLVEEYHMVVYHRATETSVDVLTGLPREIMGTQRRRRLGSGS